MDRNSRKKERRRLNRQQRKRELRRQQSRSPYQVIGSRGEIETCYVNQNWREEGVATILCLRRPPGRAHAMAAFLVDLWCMGLKDAWGRLEISSDEFQEEILEPMSKHLDLVGADPDLAKRIVAGGIRFANQNSFRLPKRYDRWRFRRRSCEPCYSRPILLPTLDPSPTLAESTRIIRISNLMVRDRSI